MGKHIYDENNGLWYELKGDYYIPCLTISEEEQQPIGMWGVGIFDISVSIAKDCISLLLSGKLKSYLAELNEQAEDMFFRLVKELAEKEDITEALKAAEQIEWGLRMNAARETATEIVNNDLIYA